MNIFELQETLVKTTKVLAGKNLPVHLEGFQPRVEYNTKTKEPEAVYLPVVTEDTPPKLIDAIHGFIDHECGHIHLSDSDDICDTTKNKLWHYIHNCIEDPRVNKGMGDIFPGSRKNIKRAYDYLFTELKDDKGDNPYSREFLEKQDLSDPKTKAKFQLQYAPLWFAGKMGCPLSRQKFLDLHLDNFYEDLMEKADPEEIRKLENIESAKDVADRSEYWTNFFSEEVLDEMNPDKGKGKGKGSKDGLSDEEINKLMEGVEDLEGQLAKLLEQQLIDHAIAAKEGIYWTDRFDKKLDKHEILREIKSNAHARGGAGNVAAFEEKTKQVTNFLAKDLRRLLEERRRRYYIGGYKSGKLNSKSLFSVRVGNDRIFKKKNEIRDVNACVSLLVDMSGSMHGSKIFTAMQSAYAFAMTLQALKVPFEVYGFVTENPDGRMGKAYDEFIESNPKIKTKIINERSPERFYAFKEFDSAFDIFCKQAMCGAGHDAVQMIQNEDSKHVRLAVQRLSARPEKVKALFVFSDGVPAYISSNVTKSYDQLKYISKTAKQKFGVDIYSIGIQSNSVQKFYDQYKVVHEVSELPTAMFEFLRKIFK